MGLHTLSGFALFLFFTVPAGFAEPQCIRSSKPDLLDIPTRAFSTGVLPPRVTYMPEPEYDDESRTSQVQGVVILWIELDGDGKLKYVKPIQSWGHSLKEPEKCSVPEGCPLPAKLVRNAVENVWHWKFEPACKDGHGVPTKINVDVSFHLY